MKLINNNFIFYLMGFTGMFILLTTINLILHSSISIASFGSFLAIFLIILCPGIVIIWLLKVPRLYIKNEFLIIKRGFKISEQIPLREIRGLRKISAFPYGFDYSNLIRRYKIDFINRNTECKTITFFDTLSNNKKILELLDRIKEENLFVKHSI